jgi:hypothetical protein
MIFALHEACHQSAIDRVTDSQAGNFAMIQGDRAMARKALFSALLSTFMVLAVGLPAEAADVICYNCPPQWADWASMLKAIKADLGYDIPFDNKNSGQALSQLIAEKANPIADIVAAGSNPSDRPSPAPVAIFPAARQFHAGQNQSGH